MGDILKKNIDDHDLQNPAVNNLNNPEVNINGENGREFEGLSTAVAEAKLVKENLAVNNEDMVIKPNTVDSQSIGNRNSFELSLLSNKDYPTLINNISVRYSESRDKNIASLTNYIERFQENKKNNTDGLKNGQEDLKPSEGNESTNKILSFEQYLLKYDTQEGFNEFLKSEQASKIVSEYFRTFIDEDGKTHFKRTSELSLTANLNFAWRMKLKENYNFLYGIHNDKKHEEEINKCIYLRNKIDGIVSKYLRETDQGDDSYKLPVSSLDNLLKEILEDDSFKFEDDESKKSFMENFNRVLRECIREYSLLSENNKDDKTLNLQLQSYLYLYGKYFYGNAFKTHGGNLNEYERELNKIKFTILYYNGDINAVEYNEYLAREKAINEEYERRQREARERAFKRNMDRNNNLGNIPIDGSDLDGNKNNYINLENASGADIAQERGLGKKLNQFKMDNSGFESDNNILKKTAFSKACNDYIQDLDENTKKYISKKNLYNIFNLGENGLNFNETNRKKFELDREKKGVSKKKLDEIEKILRSTFPLKYEECFNELSGGAHNRMEQVHEIVKNHAIGAVIDNIKDVFNNLIMNNRTGQYLEGFTYNEAEPVRIEGNQMIISGYFRGEVINISYDINTGKLYMNSYVSKLGDAFVIGGTSPSVEIGSIESFDAILQDFYDTPTDSMTEGIYGGLSGKKIKKGGKRRMEEIKESNRLRLQKICGTEIDKIGDNIMREIDKNSSVNSTISSLMKTLNIYPKFENVIFENGSDLYSFTQIVQNSEQYELNEFLGKMPDFFKLLGLKRGENNMKQDKTLTYAKIIFNYNGENENLGYLKEKTMNFMDETKDINIAQFGRDKRFGILNVFIEKFTTGKKPNWKFDYNQMIKFIGEINKEVDTVYSNVELDSKLNTI